jgi:hypothetical protein
MKYTVNHIKGKIETQTIVASEVTIIGGIIKFFDYNNLIASFSLKHFYFVQLKDEED